MESKKKYKVGEDTYNIDDNDSKLFLKDFPNAIEVFSYVADGDTYNLDASDIKPFLKDFPDAKPTLKKKKIQRLPQRLFQKILKFHQSLQKRILKIMNP